MVSKCIPVFALVGIALAKVQFLGVSIAGGDFGCQIDGTCPLSSAQLPLRSLNLGGGDGIAQMNHFSSTHAMNMFRLPISWQFLVNNQLGGPLHTPSLSRYDRLLQACLATGAHCMIDIHNFARWDGNIIGQSSTVTTEHFVSLWTQLATRYKDEPRVVFALMNEPHHLDVDVWAGTCQEVINGIRNAGATEHMILLPGTNFDSAATLVSSGSAEALMALRNPDGTTDGLLLDIHKYLDEDNSGTHAECVTNNIEAFAEVAQFLRRTGRKGFVSETGAAPTGANCVERFCEQNAFVNENADVFVGLVGWAAGSFGTDYLLSLTPRVEGGRFVDNELLLKCVVGTWTGETPPAVPAVSSSSVGSLSSRTSVVVGSSVTGSPSVGVSSLTGGVVSSTTSVAVSGSRSLGGSTSSEVTPSQSGAPAASTTRFTNETAATPSLSSTAAGWSLRVPVAILVGLASFAITIL